MTRLPGLLPRVAVASAALFLLSLSLISWNLDVVRARPGEEPAAAKKEAARKEAGGKKGAKTNPAIGGILDADPAATGTIKGVIRFKGKKPEGKPTKVPADHKDIKVCGGTIPYETHIIGPKGELKNVVVSLGNSPAFKRGKPREIHLMNRHCRFVPHVQATTVRSKLIIESEDPVLHSALAVGAANFNVAIPSPKTRVPKRLTREGWVILSCSTHSWMRAHIKVFRHDFFAVTGKDGAFTIKGVPPGEYSIDVWHEGLEPKKLKVKVEAGKTATVNAELEPWK